MRPKSKKLYLSHLGKIDLSGIGNRNEKRVLENLPEILAEFTDFHPDLLDVQDIYALSLNLLPPRYTQAFSIVLREPVSDAEVREAVRSAIQRVQNNPKSSSD